MKITIYESITAWFDTPMMEETRYQMDLEKYVLEKPAASIFIRVKGNSMQDAGIFTWDLVIVDKSKTPKIGDIVVACIDSRYTLKFYEKDTKGRIFLRAGNSEYPDIFPKEELEIFWVVVSLIRKY